MCTTGPDRDTDAGFRYPDTKADAGAYRFTHAKPFHPTLPTAQPLPHLVSLSPHFLNFARALTMSGGVFALYRPPTALPSKLPSKTPTGTPSLKPTNTPSRTPTVSPTVRLLASSHLMSGTLSHPFPRNSCHNTQVVTVAPTASPTASSYHPFIW